MKYEFEISLTKRCLVKLFELIELWIYRGESGREPPPPSVFLKRQFLRSPERADLPRRGCDLTSHQQVDLHVSLPNIRWTRRLIMRVDDVNSTVRI